MMIATLESEVRLLIDALILRDYEPNPECENDVCRILARIRDLIPSQNGTA